LKTFHQENAKKHQYKPPPRVAHHLISANKPQGSRISDLTSVSEKMMKKYNGQIPYLYNQNDL
jgi:hypothetical protein